MCGVFVIQPAQPFTFSIFHVNVVYITLEGASLGAKGTSLGKRGRASSSSLACCNPWLIIAYVLSPADPTLSLSWDVVANL